MPIEAQEPRHPDKRPADWPIRSVKISEKTWGLLRRHCVACDKTLYRVVDEAIMNHVAKSLGKMGVGE